MSGESVDDAVENLESVASASSGAVKTEGYAPRTPPWRKGRFFTKKEPMAIDENQKILLQTVSQQAHNILVADGPLLNRFNHAMINAFGDVSVPIFDADHYVDRMLVTM